VASVTLEVDKLRDSAKIFRQRGTHPYLFVPPLRIRSFQISNPKNPEEIRANRPVSCLSSRRMNIQVAVLCDAATEENGKLNLLGAFDTIIAQQIPATHPQCSIALRVTFGHEDEGSHKLRLNFVDADGRFIMPGIDLPAEVVLPGDSHFGTRNFIVTFQQLKFDLPGLYSIDISLDGKPQASIPLLVKHTPTPPAPPA
jgi:hypothetical protein